GSLLLRDTVSPRTLPEKIATFSPLMRLVTAVYGVLICLAAPQLGVDRYPTAAAIAVALGVSAILIGIVIEPMNERLVFPHAFATKPAEPSTGRRGWWWAHYLITLF